MPSTETVAMLLLARFTDRRGEALLTSSVSSAMERGSQPLVSARSGAWLPVWMFQALPGVPASS